MTEMLRDQAEEVAAGTRFAFGANWSRFLRTLDGSRIARAEQSLVHMLGMRDLRGLRFLDAGSGSGLFSLAARRLGATVYSFDYDPDSVRCTAFLKDQFFPDDRSWQIAQGSVLDPAFVGGLGDFDIVYSWGVLHHTGAMWRALGEATTVVAPGGHLFIALYNDQGWKTRYWSVVKRWYCAHRSLRGPIVAVHAPFMILLPLIAHAAKGGLQAARGMSRWYDLIDWVGGYPFEAATPQAVIDFAAGRGLRLKKINRTMRLGCNEFLFVKDRP